MGLKGAYEHTSNLSICYSPPKGSTKKMVFFRNISLRKGGYSLTLCEMVAIVFGLENGSFLAKSDIFIPKCTEGGVHQFRNYS